MVVLKRLNVVKVVKRADKKDALLAQGFVEVKEDRKTNKKSQGDDKK